MKFAKGIVFAVLLVGLVWGARSLLHSSRMMNEAGDGGSVVSTSAASSDGISTHTETAVKSGTTTENENQLAAKDLEQIHVLDEIFQSKNDNDPRMDRLLRDLSEPLKKELQKKYSQIKPENRNERGTIVFLIGREIAEGRGSTSDLQFFQSVLMEKPCLSLEDCSKSPSGQGPNEQHLESIHETTIQYPQLMGMRYLKKALEDASLSPVMKEAVLAILEAARNSPNIRVVSEVEATLGSFNGK